MFAMKGLSVVTCPWRNAGNAVLQVQDMKRFRDHSTPEMSDRFMGMVQTIWSGAGSFMNEYYNTEKKVTANSQAECFRAMFTEINNQTKIN
jgi:hypothetical protein